MINDGDTAQRTALPTLGRYRLTRRIGQGGMGDVWLAEDPRLHRQVAIKTLPVRGLGDRDFSLRFEREAQAAAALNHPHILNIHDYGEQELPGGRVITYIVMPYVAGGSLADRVVQYAARRARLPAGEAVAYLAQAADAIDYAHGRGIIHRDIKPANMLLRSDDWLLLADFGIARILSNAENLTQTGQGFGTPEYMAPEQAQGRAEAASDNYSLAVIAYLFFTGRLPFSADTGYAITIQHMTMPPPSPRQFNPAIAPSLEQALLSGLAKQPAERPPSALAFVADLRSALADAPYEATYTPALASDADDAQTAPETQPRQAAILSRRRLIIAGGGAALVVAGGGLGAWELASRARGGPTPTPAHLATPRPAATAAFDPNAPSIVIQGVHTKGVTSLAWSPRASVFASVSDNDSTISNLYLWDMQQMQRTAPATPAPSATPAPKAQRILNNGSQMQLCWSPDGSSLAIANTGNALFSNSQTISLYTSDLSKSIAALTAPNPDPKNSIITFEGLGWLGENAIVAVSDQFKFPPVYSTFVVWTADTRQATRQLASTQMTGVIALSSNPSSQQPPLLAVAPHGATLAIGLYGGVISGKLSLAGGRVKWQQLGSKLPLEQTTDEAYTVAWSPDGRTLASYYSLSTSSTLYLWSWPGRSKREIATSAAVTTMAWCPAAASHLLAAGTQDGHVLIWDLAKKGNKAVATLNSGSVSGEILALAWSADGNWLAASYNDNEASILLWKIQGRGF